MAVKSLITIDVNSSEFDRFKEKFDKYRAAQAEQPGVWKEIGASISAAAADLGKLGKLMDAHGKAARENDEADKQRFTRLKDTEKLWTSIGKSSSFIAKNVLDVGAGLLKWGAFLAGGVVGGTLFGIDKLAGSAADNRRAATGLGLSIGERNSFATNFQRFVDPSGFLTGINEATSDVSKQGPLYGIGVNPNQSTGQVAIDTLKRVRALALGTPENQLGLLESSRNLGQLGLSVEDLRRLRAASPQEFNAQIAHYGSDVRSLGVSDNTGLAWQNFTGQMERAGKTIENVLINKLSPLAGPLTNLSNSVVRAFERFADGGAIAEGVNDVAKWINKWNGEIAKPEFLTKIEQFTSDVGALADVIHGVADAAKNPVGAAGKLVWDDFTKGNALRWEGIKALFGFGVDKSFAAHLAMLDASKGLPAGFLERQWMAESGGKLDPADSPKGAIGAFQFMPGTAKSFGVNPRDPYSSAEGASTYDAALLNKYKGDIAAALAAYNWGEGNVDKLQAAHPNDWQNYLPKETRDYLAKQITARSPGVAINIYDNTGGNVNVAASAFAQ